MSKRNRENKRNRHKWNKTGNWQGSRDVRTCQKCGAKAYKTGLYSGYKVAWRDARGREVYYDRMPECRG